MVGPLNHLEVKLGSHEQKTPPWEVDSSKLCAVITYCIIRIFLQIYFYPGVALAICFYSTFTLVLFLKSYEWDVAGQIEENKGLVNTDISVMNIVNMMLLHHAQWSLLSYDLILFHFGWNCLIHGLCRMKGAGEYWLQKHGVCLWA